MQQNVVKMLLINLILWGYKAEGTLSIQYCKKLLIYLYMAHMNKSSAVADMGHRGHNRHGPKREGTAVPLLQGSWVPV